MILLGRLVATPELRETGHGDHVYRGQRAERRHASEIVADRFPGPDPEPAHPRWRRRYARGIPREARPRKDCLVKDVTARLRACTIGDW